MCLFPLDNSDVLCLIGMLTKTTFLLVKAHRVEVTAESIPPEIPITKPFIFALER